MPLLDAGWSSLVARRAHNPKVVGSNPAPATTNDMRALGFPPSARFAFLHPLTPALTVPSAVLMTDVHGSAHCGQPTFLVPSLRTITGEKQPGSCSGNGLENRHVTVCLAGLSLGPSAPRPRRARLRVRA